MTGRASVIGMFKLDVADDRYVVFVTGSETGCATDGALNSVAANGCQIRRAVAAIDVAFLQDTRVVRLVCSAANEKGLEMKSSQPAARHRCRAIWSGNAVAASMGMLL